MQYILTQAEYDDLCRAQFMLTTARESEFRVIKECRDRFMVNSVSWKLLDDVLQTEPDVKAEPPVANQPYLWVSPSRLPTSQHEGKK